MDPKRFDDLLRSLSSGASRRGLLTGLVGGLLAALPLAHSEEVAEAKRRRFKGRRRRRKHRRWCIPNCAGRTCGGNGCGGSCGYCGPGSVCRRGTCQPVCVPNCTGKTCGGDGCGGSCGFCGNDRLCLNGACVCRVKDCGNGLCCPVSAQQCCPGTLPTDRGFCAPLDATCCSIEQGGSWCPPDRKQCCSTTMCLKPDETCCTDVAGGWCPSDAPNCCPPTETFPAGSCCENDATTGEPVPCCTETGDCADENLICVTGCCVAPPEGAPRVSASLHERQDPVLRAKP
jgi:hypothetical protein